MPDQIFVLVAEDEELVRVIIVDALEDEGFEVMEAEHTDAALDILQAHAARIHVLLPISTCRAPWTVLPLRIIPRSTGPTSRF